MRQAVLIALFLALLLALAFGHALAVASARPRTTGEVSAPKHFLACNQLSC
ncbi:MAG TPA: hypothetical protein VFZ44_04635 [Pyrinomonadaceae bacterium]